MDETLNTGGSSWESWFQNVAGGLIDKAGDAQYVRPYDIQEMRLQALGDLGLYSEGQAGAYRQQAAGMTTGTMLMIGGVILAAVFMLKD